MTSALLYVEPLKRIINKRQCSGLGPSTGGGVSDQAIHRSNRNTRFERYARDTAARSHPEMRPHHGTAAAFHDGSAPV
jgi:hypothetical protein